MKKQNIFLAFLLILALFFTSCNSSKTSNDTKEGARDDKVIINISAAASLAEALTEIQEEYEKENAATIQFNFAGSGSLQKQIQEGAPCDLFISASKDHMDVLEEVGLIQSKSRKDILTNRLTLIAPKEKSDYIVGIDSLINEEIESISIGEPSTVPAGNYAQQSFERLGILDEVKDKIVYGKDVKQVLWYVETGNVDSGLVYKSDALLLETGVIVGDVSEEIHDPIVYPAALIHGSKEIEAAADFYEFLQTHYGKSIFEKYGFTPL